MAGATALLGLGATLPPPFGPVVGALAAGTGACAWVADRYANDPADLDFETAAIPSPAVVPIEDMSRAFDAPSAVVAFGESVNETYAYTSAAIRAFERAQGARIRGNTNELAKRLTEAQKHARAGSAAVEQRARGWQDLAAVMSDLPDADALRSRMPPTTPRDLPDSTLAFLYVAGVPRGRLTRALDAASSWSVSRGFAAVGDELRGAAEPTLEFAAFLRAWEPAV